MARFLFFRQKGRYLFLVLAVALVICGCGRKAPPVPPERSFTAVIEFDKTAFDCNGPGLQADSGHQMKQRS